MPFPGVCQSCRGISYGLRICAYCGAKVCPGCLEGRETPCKICKKEEKEPDFS